MSLINSSLASKKEENKKLELFLRSQQDDHELTLTRINKDHNTTVQELRTQVCNENTKDLLLIVLLLL